jgi:hypothetical protein
MALFCFAAGPNRVSTPKKARELSITLQFTVGSGRFAPAEYALSGLFNP